MFNRNIIRDRVLAHIYARIEEAQKRLDETFAHLNAKHQAELAKLENKFLEDKEDAINELVNDVLNNT